MIPQRVPNPFTEQISNATVCAMADRWGVEPELITRLIMARFDMPFDVWIFSGARTRSTQGTVSRTPFHLSTHADESADGCPRLATGVDAQPTDVLNRVDLVVVAQMGAAWTRQGLRWGGGARVGGLQSDAGPGIPVGVERWHVDLGPRR